MTKQMFTCNSCDYDFWIDVTLPPHPQNGNLFCPSCGYRTMDRGNDIIPQWKMNKWTDKAGGDNEISQA